MTKNTYFFYILIGLSYPVVKVIYYLKDLVCINGVIYGTIIGVLTISAGILLPLENIRNQASP